LTRDTFFFDGDSSFCCVWAEFWRGLTGDRVEYVPEPGRPIEFRQYKGAEAIFVLLSLVSGYEWLLRYYRRIPGLAWLIELKYRFIGRHRDAAYRVTRLLWGSKIERPTYRTASALFSRALAFIYLIAFASFGMQVRGLIGSDGILPVTTYFQLATSTFGSAALWKVPSLFWWAHTDFALLSIPWGGVALAAVAILARPHSVWQRAIFAILFVYYLSIVSAGQIFMSYQWDLLLLETGFLAIFLRPSLPRVWLFQWLLFRLMFESGLVKLTSHDPTWRNLTALSFHYWTQPLPTVFGWFAAHLPMVLQKVSTAVLFAVELGLPLLMFGPRRVKQVAAFGTIGLQILILLTGNYTFFNLLALALCLFLFDDQFFAKKKYVPASAAWSSRYVSAVLFLFVMTVSCVEIAAVFGPVASEFDAVVQAQGSFGLVNGYGLFAVMTTTRDEIEIEGSNDNQNWQPYVFRYKAGPLNRAPGWVAPFQPRLDWQMWFAALGTYRDNPWFVRFLLKLLEGSRPVLALMERDPFDGVPPKHIRAMVYEYRFSSIEEWRRTGNWWTREMKGLYFPSVSLKDR
jgi:hypothetical protein